MKAIVSKITDGKELAYAVSHCFKCGKKLETDDICHYFEDNTNSPNVRIAVFCGSHLPKNQAEINRWVEIDMVRVPMEDFIEAMKIIKSG